MVQAPAAVAHQAILWGQDRALLCLVGLLHHDAHSGGASRGGRVPLRGEKGNWRFCAYKLSIGYKSV